jgi:hypothetical protein
VRVTLSRPLTGKNLELNIYSIDGKLVIKKHIDNQSISTDISELKDGMYLIRTGSNQPVKMIKLDSCPD